MANERLAKAIGNYLGADLVTRLPQMPLAQSLAVQTLTDRGWRTKVMDRDGTVTVCGPGQWAVRIDRLGCVR